MNKLIPKLKRDKSFECQYEKCHRRMASRQTRNLHHVKCNKRTDSGEDDRIYELSLAFLTPEQREAVNDVGKNRLRKRHKSPVVPDDKLERKFLKVTGEEATKKLSFAERYRVMVDIGRMEFCSKWEILAEDKERNCLIVRVPLGKT